MCTLLYILVCKEAVLLRHWQLLFIEHGVSPTFKCTFHYYYYYSANLALFLEPRLGVDRLLVVPWDGCLVPRLKPGRDVDALLLVPWDGCLVPRRVTPRVPLRTPLPRPPRVLEPDCLAAGVWIESEPIMNVFKPDVWTRIFVLPSTNMREIFSSF